MKYALRVIGCGGMKFYVHQTHGVCYLTFVTKIQESSTTFKSAQLAEEWSNLLEEVADVTLMVERIDEEEK